MRYFLSILMTTALVAGPAASPTLGQQATDPPTTLTVQNERDVPVMVFIDEFNPGLATSGLTTMNPRIGSVAPNATATITVPAWALSQPTEEITFHLYAEGQGNLEPARFAAVSGRDFGVIVAEDGEVLDEADAPAIEPGSPALTVINEKNVSVTILAEEEMMNGSVAVLVGTAPPEATTTMAIPDPISGEEGDNTRFIVHPDGGIDEPAREVSMDSDGNITLWVFEGEA